MIINGIEKVCPKCANVALIKASKDKNGQRWQCKDKACNHRPYEHNLLTKYDADIVLQSVKSEKKNQRLQDLNRIERKGFRESARMENALSAYNEKLNELLTNHTLTKLTIQHSTTNPQAVGVFHVTDVHFNELVALANNKYDFHVASSRLYHYIRKATKYFKSNGVTNVLLAFTGDMMNSDRRRDEMLAMCSNRSKATFLAVDILQQMILDINRNFNVTVAGVCGNEGRVNQELGFEDLTVSDNYDYTIFNVLRKIFEGSTGVVFRPMDNPSEVVVEVAGQNWLLIHGHMLGKNYDRTIAEKKAQWMTLNNTRIRYVLFGHLHSAYISDMWARGSSPCGENTYSKNALGLVSRASQNCFIAYDDDSIDGLKIDLQNVDTTVGYRFDSALEAYNPKSADKARKTETIFKVVV